MERKALVLGVEKYDFRDDEGNQVKGAKISLLSDKLNGENQKGYRTAKFNVSHEIADKVQSAPALCKVLYEMKVNGNGNVSLRIVDVKQDKEVDLQKYLV